MWRFTASLDPMSLPFRLATFNLENLDSTPGDSGVLARRIAALRPVLLGLEADILCLQEVNARRTEPGGQRRLLGLDAVIDGTRYAGFQRAVTMQTDTSGPADVHNLVTLSRFPIERQRSVCHDIVAPWQWQPPAGADGALPAVAITWERPLLYTRLVQPGGTRLHIVNLHLRAPRAAHIAGAKERSAWRSTAGWAEGFFVAAQKRAGQALEARLLVERLFDADVDAEIAVCGDFNADEHEMPTRLLLADTANAGDRAPPGRTLAALERRVPTPLRYSVIHAGRHVMLDHILASPSLAARCGGVTIGNVDLADETLLDTEQQGSLHAPVVAAFGAGRPA